MDVKDVRSRFVRWGVLVCALLGVLSVALGFGEMPRCIINLASCAALFGLSFLIGDGEEGEGMLLAMRVLALVSVVVGAINLYGLLRG